LSADIGIFNSFFIERKKAQISHPSHFLYVGRLSKEKGVDLLFEAWNKIKEHRKGWKLTAIGNGPLLDELKRHEDIEIIDFLQPSELIKQLDSYGCLIIPSRKEQWSLVMHEFAAAGFPIIASNVCGALPLFLVPNYNGFVFNSLNVDDLADQMIKIINLPTIELSNMSMHSHELGQRITPEIAAANFLSVLS
jgi:glycosyltransferase involved in cell wall biosynthesis